MSLLFRPRRPSVGVTGDAATYGVAFSDIEFSSETDVVNGTGCAEWTVTAVHTGPLVVDGENVDPTGGRVTVRGVTVAELSGDGIRTVRHYWDELAMLDGLGLLPRD